MQPGALFLFNICRHYTYQCGWLGADRVAGEPGIWVTWSSGPNHVNMSDPDLTTYSLSAPNHHKRSVRRRLRVTKEHKQRRKKNYNPIKLGTFQSRALFWLAVR